MRQDLISQISAQQGTTNAIVLTHNIDFVFLQLVLLRALRQCGRPTLTVFADAQCAAESYAHQAPLLGGLGRRYRVVPVSMEAGFRFHPKAVMLSGPEKASLWVGSGNLTFGGWRENAEAWVRFDSDLDSTAPFSAFRNYLTEVLARVPLSDSIQGEIDEAFDPGSRGWATQMLPPAGLIGRVGRGPTLLEQIEAMIGTAEARQLVVCSPYFDDEGEALLALSERMGSAQVDVLVQSKFPGLSKRAADRVTPRVNLVPVGFTREGENGSLRESFVHAKFYGIRGDERTQVITGSANCSRAALTVPGPGGNAELAAVQEMEWSAFQEVYLNELPRSEGSLSFPEVDPEPELPEVSARIRVQAARYDYGILRLAYASSPSVEITHCLLGDIQIPTTPVGKGQCSIELTQAPGRVRLQGQDNGTVVCSPEFWVDIEGDLRSSAAGRSVADALNRNVRGVSWSIGAWREVMTELCRHLEYLPNRASSGVHAQSRSGARELQEFTAANVFTSGYGLPGSGAMVVSKIGSDRVHSLQQMLLRWFGVTDDDEGDSNGVEEAPTASDDDEDLGDRPSEFPDGKRGTRTPPKAPTEADRKRAKRIIDQLTTAICSEQFLTRRPPELLAADLKIASVLLRTALNEGWIEPETFFESSRLIWSSLFFESSDRPTQGWLERRHLEAEDPDDFALRLASPQLAAALAVWSIASARDETGPSAVRHLLAQILAVARLPWLWRGGSLEQIGEEMARMLDATSRQETSDEYVPYADAWRKLIRRGEALRQLEKALLGKSPAELVPRISATQVKRGELLWQGTAGFLVSLEDGSRDELSNVRVLCLQGAKEEKHFRGSLLVPVRSLLDARVLPEAAALDPMVSETLQEMLDELGEKAAQGRR